TATVSFNAEMNSPGGNCDLITIADNTATTSNTTTCGFADRATANNGLWIITATQQEQGRSIAPPTPLIVQLDNTQPTVAVTAPSPIIAGIATLITFTVSDKNTDFAEDDITATGGNLTAFRSTSGTTYIATFTATAASTAVIEVTPGNFSDAAGNPSIRSFTGTHRLELTVNPAPPPSGTAPRLTVQVLGTGSGQVAVYEFNWVNFSFEGIDITRGGVITETTVFDFGADAAVHYIAVAHPDPGSNLSARDCNLAGNSIAYNYTRNSTERAVVAAALGISINDFVANNSCARGFLDQGTVLTEDATISFTFNNLSGPDTGPAISVTGGDGVMQGDDALFYLTASKAPGEDLPINITPLDVGTGDFLAPNAPSQITLTAATTTATIRLPTQDGTATVGSVALRIERGNGYTLGTPAIATVQVGETQRGALSTPSLTVQILGPGRGKVAVYEALTSGGQLLGIDDTRGGIITATTTFDFGTDPSFRFIAIAHPDPGNTLLARDCRATGNSFIINITAASFGNAQIAADLGIATADFAANNACAYGFDDPINIVTDDRTITFTFEGPTLTLTGGDPIMEGDNAIFYLNANRALNTTLPINITAANISGGDFLGAGAPSRITLAATATRATVMVPTRDGSASDGAIKLSINTGSGYIVGRPFTATVRVGTMPPGPQPPSLRVQVQGEGSGQVAVYEISGAENSLRLDDSRGGLISTSRTFDFGSDPRFRFIAIAHPDPGNTLSARNCTLQDNSQPLDFTATSPNHAQVAAALGISADQLAAGNACAVGFTQSALSVDYELAIAFTFSPPALSLTTGPSPITEGEAATFIVNANIAPSADLTVSMAVRETRGNYIAGTAPNAVTLTRGTTTATLTVNTLNDTTPESSGAVQAVILAGPGYVLRELAPATVEVHNDDADNSHPRITLNVSASAVTEGDSLVFTVTASPVNNLPIDVNALVSQTGDYIPADELVAGELGFNLPAGSGQAIRSITIPDDMSTAADGTLALSLTGGGYVLGTPHSVTVAVSDTETELSIAANAATFNERDDVTFTITALAEQKQGLVVDVMVSQQPTRDYLDGAPPTQVTIAAGESTALLRVPILNDKELELNATITAAITASPRYRLGIASDDARVLDNDVGVYSTKFNPDGSGVALRITEGRVTEGFPRAIYVVVGEPALEPLSVTVNISQVGDSIVDIDGSVVDVPADGETQHTVTIAAGDTGARFIVRYGDDNMEGPHGQVIYSAVAVPPAYELGGPSFMDSVRDISAPKASLLAAPAVWEGEPLMFVVTLSGVSFQNSEVPYGTELRADSAIIPSGTEFATRDADYTAVFGRLTFPSGVTRLTIAVQTILDEDYTEPSESMNIELLPPGLDAAVEGDLAAGIIYNVPAVTLAAASTTAVAIGGEAAFVITASAPVGAALTVNVAVSQESGTGSETFTFATGATTATLSVTVNDVSSGTDHISAQLQTGARYALGAETLASVNIKIPAITLAAGTTANAREGGTAPFLITTPVALGVDLTVNVAISQESGATRQTATLSAGDTSVTLDAIITENDRDEVDGSRHISAQLQTGRGYTLGTETLASVGIEDNDGPVIDIAHLVQRPGVNNILRWFTDPPATEESEIMVFTVTLSYPPVEETRVTWGSSGGGSAKPNTDYVEDFRWPQGLTFVGNRGASTTRSITVALIDDNTREPAETIEVSFGNPSNDATLARDKLRPGTGNIYFRGVIAASDQPVVINPTVDLQAASDTGASDEDDLTGNNRPTFTLSNLTVDATVTVLAIHDIASNHRITYVKNFVAAAASAEIGFGSPGAGGQCNLNVFQDGSSTLTPLRNDCRLTNNGSWRITIQQEKADEEIFDAVLRITIDTQPPTLTLAAGHSAMLIGASTVITLTADGADTALAESHITASGGSLSNFAAAGSNAYTVTFTAAATATTASIFVAAGSAGGVIVTDTAGNHNTASNTLVIPVDGPTVVSLTADGVTTENSPTFPFVGFMLEVNPTLRAALTVNVAVSETGGYIAAADVKTHQVTIPAGASIAFHNIALLDDSTDEGGGTVSFSLLGGHAYTVDTAANGGTVRVVDDEGKPEANVTALGGAQTAISSAFEGDTFTYRISFTPELSLDEVPSITFTLSETGDYFSSAELVLDRDTATAITLGHNSQTFPDATGTTNRLTVRLTTVAGGRSGSTTGGGSIVFELLPTDSPFVRDAYILGDVVRVT
ncbi:MAG: Ig-like domain-containing protein, partial [Pseudohongiellaceae bacterium]